MSADVSPETTLVAGYQYVDQDDAWRTHRTVYGISWEGSSVGTDHELVFDQRRELAYLIVHGTLHLLGYDHETEPERQVMREKEEAALAEVPRTMEPQ